MSTQQRLRYEVVSLDREFNDLTPISTKQEVSSSHLVSEHPSASIERDHFNSARANKNPLYSEKDGGKRLALTRSSTTEGSGFHYQKPFEGEAIQSSSPQLELVGVSYFPDHVARVSYIASVVKPDVNGNYLKDLERGMDSLATRLAPSYFPGTIIRLITTQVDGYFPAVCPSNFFSNCQDVTASIGIYLSAVNEAGEGYVIGNDSNYHSLEKTKDVAIHFDPSIMTEELFAFEESLKAAISNNELQDAIEQKYHQNHNANTAPSVVIVTDSIYNSNTGFNTEKNSNSDHGSIATVDLVDSDKDSIENSDKNATQKDDFFVNDVETSSTLMVDITSGDPSVSTTSIVAARKSEGSIKIGLATGGIIGILLMFTFMISFLVMVRRRRSHNDGRQKGASITRVQEKFKKSDTTLHSKKKIRDVEAGHDQSDEKLLESISVVYKDNDGVDEEEGLVDIMTRNGRSKSGHDTFAKEKFEANNFKTFGSCYPDNNVVEERNNSQSSDNSSEINYQNDVLPRVDLNDEGRKIVGNLSGKIVVSSDDSTPLNNENNSHNGTLKGGVSNTVHISVDDEENDENDFVFGEGDDSDISVEQHLLSVNGSSDFSMAPSLQSSTTQGDNFTTPSHPTKTTINCNLTLCHKSVEKGTDSDHFNSKTEISNCSQKLSPTPFQSSFHTAMCNHSGRQIEMMDDINLLEELDVAISKCDWATVGATAAVLASTTSVMQPQMPRRVNRRYSSSFVRSSDYLQKAEELDRLIETEDWQALVFTAAKYDVEGLSCAGSAIEERSKTSTQDSDANDSYVSIMDYSSGGQSNSICRSVLTPVSQKERLQEIREKVTKMVEDVVPDEVQNIDEMMIQFKGREEDLLEALQTMKERNVVRKARLESQKIARRNTRPVNDDSLAAIQSPDANEVAVYDDSDIEEQEKLFTADFDYKRNAYNPMKKDDAAKSNHVRQKEGGSFEHVTAIDPDQAAAAAAAWAIQRSLNEMIENEERVSAHSRN